MGDDHASRLFSAVLQPGQHWNAPQWSVFPSVGAKGYWRMVYTVAWTDRLDRPLGTGVVVPNLTQDNYCTFPGCTRYPGYLYIDSLFHFR